MRVVFVFPAQETAARDLFQHAGNFMNRAGFDGMMIVRLIFSVAVHRRRVNGHERRCAFRFVFHLDEQGVGAGS